MKFVLALLAVLFLGGCSEINKIHPNLATQLVPKYPELKHICDYAGGCENVSIKCTRFDGKGNTNLRNQTEWEIETGSIEDNNWESGWSFQDNSSLNTHVAINTAIETYWYWWKVHQEQKSKSTAEPDVYPNTSSCDKDCWK